MSFDRQWYRSLKSALVKAELTKHERQILSLIWNHPLVPVGELPKKAGKKLSGGINLTVGSRIGKRKLWKRMPKRIRQISSHPDGTPFYCGLLVTTPMVVDRSNHRSHCFQFRPEAQRALQELKIISKYAAPPSSEYTLLEEKLEEVELRSTAPAEEKRTLRAIIARRGQVKFRRSLMRAYAVECVVTGCTEECVLEAAHINPFSKRGRYDVANGLLLRADWHTLFDLGLWAVDPKTRKIQVSAKLSQTYRGLHGRYLKQPIADRDAPKSSALKRRFQLFKRKR